MELYILRLTEYFLEELYYSYKSGSKESKADLFKNANWREPHNILTLNSCSPYFLLYMMWNLY